MLQRKILSLSNLSIFLSFRKKKKFCYGFMPGDFHVICVSMVGENRWSPALTETPGMLYYHTCDSYRTWKGI